MRESFASWILTSPLTMMYSPARRMSSAVLVSFDLSSLGGKIDFNFWPIAKKQEDGKGNNIFLKLTILKTEMDHK